MALGEVPVEDSESLARMILTEKYVRKDSQTEKVTLTPLAFLPFSRIELSVIRHREITEVELWEIGRDVSAMRERDDIFGRKFPLVGHGDFFARDAREQKLDIVAAEGLGLPRNHADVIGWPPEKPAQMIRAIEIAARATFVVAPFAA